MPIKDKDLGRYKRPGIFINEIDQSIIELPVQDVLVNLVPGFSKRGPVNRPVYITNKNDFVSIFGDIDRQLERKGSFFHRTCMKMLESGPIYALNLLSTLDTRDKVDWKSISVASYYDNADVKEMPYSRLFNRQDFWTRDDESFLDYVQEYWSDFGPITNIEDCLLNLTNIGDKVITTFLFKSSITGFDVTAEEWYGSPSKVPAYLNTKDWISDYMVTVLVVEGDWTNYNVLSVDTKWSQYFTTEGLIKTKVTDFVNESAVIVLSNQDVSLIPYFQDLNGRVMYIKTVLNDKTDKTGLFASYNEDYILSSDYPTGRMDLIGDGMVDSEKDYIEFLSYQEEISENLTYTHKILDSSNNVFGNYSSALTYAFTGATGVDNTRTATFTNGYINSATISVDTPVFTKVSKFVNNYYIEVVSSTGIAIGDVVYFTNDSLLPYANFASNTPYYVVTTPSSNQFKLSTVKGGSPVQFSAKDPLPTVFIQKTTATLGNTNSNSYFVIDGIKYTFDTGNTKIYFSPLTLSVTANTANNRYDVLYLSKGNLAQVNVLTGVEKTIGTPDKPLFTESLQDNIILGYVEWKYLSGSTSITGSYSGVNLDSSGYLPLPNYSSATYYLTISGVTTNDGNYIDITFNGTSGSYDYNYYEKLRLRQVYTELSTTLSEGKGVIINAVTAEKELIPQITSYDYSSSLDAKIRIKLSAGSYTNYFTRYTNRYDAFLIYYIDDEFVIRDSQVTDRIYTTTKDINDPTLYGQSATTAAGVIGKYSALYLDYYNGNINDWDFIYVNNNTGSTLSKIYMKMWMQSTDMYLDLMDDKTDHIGVSPSTNLISWKTTYGQYFIVHSEKGSAVQTIEIEYFDQSISPDRLTQIKVDKTRYSEVGTGQFLTAYYNPIDYAIGGSKYGQIPKKLTRIVSIKLDDIDSSLKVINTDGPIKVIGYQKQGTTGYDYQTTLYPQIDTYVSTYKGVKLDPFVISQDSIPDGTETRQSSILDLLAPTTNLGKGLINKNKISWRYLIDSFGLGLVSQSKQQYADLGGAKLNCLTFVNMPSVRYLKKSTNPSFINDDRTLNTYFLRVGGDETKTPSYLYSFATGVGRSTMGYFFPYLTVDDAGIPKDVPPAMHVATTYMNKHTTNQGGVYPWTIAAGITNGRIGNIVAAEMDFTDDDLENLNQMGANPIVKKAGAGYCINSENTAQVFPYSSLSLLHSREVLIELENSMYDMLLKYQWRFNTAEIRAEIKFRADKICDNLKNSNALYDYRNIMDETNNTNFIIDLQMGVIDTYIEIIKGMGIIVNNITILRKGDIESGGFLPA